MTTVAILQPGYLPWCGYFEQMARADLFVHMDDVPFTRKDWRSRNQIKLHSAPLWLSVPTHRRPLGTLINEIEVDCTQNWQHKHKRAIESAYSKAPYFNLVADAVFPVLESPPKMLADLDISLAERLSAVLGVKTATALSSDYDVDFSDKSDRVLQLCRKVGAKCLYDGQAAKNFLDVAAFEAAGIEVEFQDYDHPQYDQGTTPFLAYMSVIDIIAHTGSQAGRLIRGLPGG